MSRESRVRGRVARSLDRHGCRAPY